jgi:hypothetical protein
LGIGSGTRVAVISCPEHRIDAAVGYVAIHKCGAQPLIGMFHSPPEASLLCALLETAGADAVLACTDYLERHGLASRGRFIADAPGVIWWKALEARHSADPLELVGNAQPDVWLLPRREAVHA